MTLSIEPSQVTFLRHPLLFTQLLFEVILIKVKKTLGFIVKHWYLFILSVAVFWAVVNLQQLRSVKQIGIFASYWILLGVASSIGLGTGLHTFVLYLGPHIARVVVASIDCGYVPEMMPSRWAFSHFKECAAVKTSSVSMLDLIFAVQIQAFLWGLGTAIGELPPYYISKQAAIRSERISEYEQNKKKGIKSNDEQIVVELKRRGSETEQQIQARKQLEEMQQLKQKKTTQLSLLQRVKLLVYTVIHKHAFITILLLASVPNPLFDLAGITCGSLKIPFFTFFFATFIGKAIIKVHIQVLFIIFLFSEHHVENLLKLIQSWVPFFENKLLDTMEKQKKLLFQPETYNSEKPLVGRLWDLFLLLMVSYFVLSIITHSIQEHYMEKKAEQKEEKKEDEKKVK